MEKENIKFDAKPDPRPDGAQDVWKEDKSILVY